MTFDEGELAKIHGYLVVEWFAIQEGYLPRYLIKPIGIPNPKCSSSRKSRRALKPQVIITLKLVT